MRHLDRLLVGAAVLLVAVVAADALRGHLPSRRHSPAPAPAAVETDSAPAETTRSTLVVTARSEMSDPGHWVGFARVPAHVRLVPSSTAFLANCPARRLRLAVGPTPVLRLAYAGAPCHVPPLHLRATVRDAAGRVLHIGPALAQEYLSGNYAGATVRTAPLAAAALGGCRSARLVVSVTGSGLAASGGIRCLGGP